MRLGLFTNVQYRYESAETGVSAEYQVKDAPTVRARFDNFPWFTDEDLIAALKHDVPLFDGTAPERGTILDDLSQALEKLLATRGIQSSSVTHEFTTAPTSGEQVQAFRLESPVLNIAGIEFSDPLAQTTAASSSAFPTLWGSHTPVPSSTSLSSSRFVPCTLPTASFA